MKKIKLITTMFVSLGLSTVFFMGSGYAADKPDVHLQFIQTAQKGVLSAIPGKQGKYTITLYQLAPFVSYFSERPKRITGLVSVAKFMGLWNNKSIVNNFTEVPPNAALETVNTKVMGDNHRIAMVATLANPVYDANAHSLTYTMTSLTTLKPNIKQANLGYTVLFVDGLGIHWNPGGF